MEEVKDCEIIFANKQTYKFNSKNLDKALQFCQDKNVFGIETPWGVLSLMNKEMFEYVRDAVFTGPTSPEEAQPEDLA